MIGQARLAVQSITVDLYSPYRKLIHELFPNAIIIADHFHVVAQVYWALNQVRILLALPTTYLAINWKNRQASRAWLLARDA